MYTLHTNQYITSTELKASFGEIANKAKLGAIAVLSHNKPKLYLLSPKEYECYKKFKEEQIIYERMQRMQAGRKKIILSPDQLAGEE